MVNKNHDLTPEDTYLDRDVSSATYVGYGEYTKMWAKLFLVVLALSFLALWGRALQLQLFAQERSAGGLLQNTHQFEHTKPYRGNMYDRYGEVLAYNTGTFDIIMDYGQLPENKNKRKDLFATMTEAFSIEQEDIDRIIENQTREIVVRDIEREKALAFQVEQGELPGFELIDSRKRDYQYPLYTSHVLGYTGPVRQEDLEGDYEYMRDDRVGRAGLEKQYEERLRGTHGLRNRIKDERIYAPKDGQDLRLTLDIELQKEFQDQLQSTLDEAEVTRASGVIMDPQTGEILAMSSLPSFDNTDFVNGISQDTYSKLLNDEDRPLTNKATTGRFAPASTVKPLLAGAFLEEGVISPETEIDDPDGRLVVDSVWSDEQYIFPDWKVHGVSDVYKSIADSVNIFYYTFAGGTPDQEGLGVEKVVHYYRQFGFGQYTGIDLPQERKGLVPSPQWKEEQGKGSWFRGDTYNIAIGQGDLLTTPLQVVNAISAIANGGTLYEPRLYHSPYTEEGEKGDFKPTVLRDSLLSSESLEVVQDGMRQTVTDGTGYQLQDLPIKTAAKTGTAQTSKDNNNSWFTSYGPVDDPEIATVVLIEEGNEGFRTSIPVTKAMYEWYDEHRGFDN